jgi:hypothetical protein
VKYFYITSRIAAGEVHVVHLPTSLILADVMTKPLFGDTFHCMENYLMRGICPPTAFDGNLSKTIISAQMKEIETMLKLPTSDFDYPSFQE